MGVKVKEWKGAWWVFVNHKGRRKAKRCASKRVAEGVRDKIDAKLKLGEVLSFDDAPRVPTFDQYAEQWQQHANLRCQAPTLEQYRNQIKLHMSPHLGSLPLTAITREHIRTLVASEFKKGNRRSPDKPLAPKTLRTVM